MSKPDITVPRNMLAIQGDRVLVYNHVDGSLLLNYVLTLIRVIDVDRQEMRMVNREGRTHKPDWLFTQKWHDSLKLAEKNQYGAKWQVTLKSKT